MIGNKIREPKRGEEPCFVLDPEGERLQNRHPDRVGRVKTAFLEEIMMSEESKGKEELQKKVEPEGKEELKIGEAAKGREELSMSEKPRRMGQTGMVFHIQKFSLHDGPGLRTTVFLKGCPLRCKWCANPESQSTRTQILYDRKKCLHCGTCLRSCKAGALKMDEDGYIHVLHEKCQACLTCTGLCPGGALTSVGEEKTVQEVMDLCLQDLPFYEESGGGVTISGGEGMMQPDFVEELVMALQEKHIHTAIETTGCVGEEVFHRLAPLFDLLLFDVKHWDSGAHQKGTGVGNEMILKNLRWAKEKGLTILPRIPVIPGFNYSEEDAKGLSSLLVSLGFTRVQLLPFHQMGERKYEFLEREYSLEGGKPLHQEDCLWYQEIFTKAGLDCFF